MTRRMLLRSVLTVMAMLGLVVALAVYARLREAGGSADWALVSGIIKDFAGLLVAIPAAWLAYCFSRRSAFLGTLEALWRNIVEAKGKCFAFTDHPDAATLLAARTALSTAIDNMRSVYRNVGETRAKIGWFPFEPLHDMRRALDRRGGPLCAAAPAEVEAIRKALRDDLRHAWYALRAEFLKEFGAPQPSNPITAIGARDPREQPEPGGR